MSFKVVNNADAGTVTKHGGNDADRVSQLFNGSDVGIPDINSSFRYRSGKLAVRNPANSFSYNVVGSAIVADRNLILPLLTADDTLVTLNLAQTLTNKVISGATNTIIDIPDSALPPGMVYTDMPNTFSDTTTFNSAPKFDTYSEVKAITPPSNPATGYARLYLDSADNKYKIKKTDGSVIDLEAVGAGAATDERVTIREAGTIVGSSSRKLNFTVPTDFEFTEDVPNDEIEAKIADNAIRDNHINAHTSTKITITDKTHLNPNTTYKDENEWLTDAMVAPHTTTKIVTSSKSLLNTQIAYKDEAAWLNDSMITGTIAKSHLATSVVHNDQNNNLGAFYQDITEIAAPTAPAANTGRLFFDSADEHLKIKKSDTTLVDLEATSGGGGGTWDPVATETIQNKTIGNHLDFTRVTAPANPATDVGRLYHKQIDANNDGMFVKLKKAGAIVEVRIL